MQKLTIIILLVNLTAAVAAPKSECLAALDVQTTGNADAVWYSNGYATDAKELNELLSPAKAYFNEHLQVDLEFEIALLNPTDWRKISRIPYGLPFVSGPPYIIGIPATTDHPLGETLKTAFTNPETPASGMKMDDPIRLFISIIGFHELGHIYAKTAGISFPNTWTDEFTATYLAYSYLAAKRPQYAALWRRGSKGLVETIQPAKTSLADFESLYYRVGIENYAWYQAVFLMRVETLHARHEFTFIDTLQKKPLPDSSSHFGLHALEDRFPGFIEWAKGHGLIE